MSDQTITIDDAFVPAGTTATAEPGQVFVDVGNRFGPGILDHHAPGTPGACTARLVLDYPQHVLSQVDATRRVTILTHQYPDLDAITGVRFARAQLRAETIDAAALEWVDYVEGIDRGHTRLDPARPINPYSVIMMRLARIAQSDGDADQISGRMLGAGLAFVDLILARRRVGFAVDSEAIVAAVPELAADVRAVVADRETYLTDRRRAEPLVCTLPRQDGNGVRSVSGLWIERPASVLFKSWARGDTQADSRPDGFIFTGVQLTDSRAILSVAPDGGVTLRGLGAVLEAAERTKRNRMGCPRAGPVRDGFDSPDPWYDGRSVFHGHTIVDAPMAGSVLSPSEVRLVFDDYLRRVGRGV